MSLDVLIGYLFNLPM